MTDLEKKVFREVFIGKAVRFNDTVEFNMIKRFYSLFNVGCLDFEYNIYQRVIKLNDNLNAYYLGDVIGQKKFMFGELERLYRKEVERKGGTPLVFNKKERDLFLEVFKRKHIKIDNYDEWTIFANACYNYHIERDTERKGDSINVTAIDYRFKNIKGVFISRENKLQLSEVYQDETFSLLPKHTFKELYKEFVKRSGNEPLPNKIAFRNNTTTLVYDNFKVVRAKASNKDEAVRETGLLVALLKALKVKDYNTIIANAWDTDNELTRHFYLYGVIQQLYLDKKLLSRNQFNKLFEAVGEKKPNVNIGGKIIELEYK